MPKRTDLKKIMIVGSGPIIIGQAAEFDFSGSQACKSLREEGYEVVLVNSNPATIQTDVDMADIVYIEPLNTSTIEKIIEREEIDGILSGMGGQTALNICSDLAEEGVLKEFGVELLGTQLEAIRTSENRDLFRSLMKRINEKIPKSKACGSIADAKKVVEGVGGFPVIVRAAYTLGGTGSGIAHNDDELERIVGLGLISSRIKQVLIEESVLGWQEYEYEVMRDADDNCIIICTMENLDPMGLHTGESIVIAPTQTLSDDDHQRLRDAALKIIRALKIEGGCNIQFAFDHDSGEYRVIEVNPRVSRSSALASKATGYPIARVAAKIAVGMRLDEIRNPITKNTFASFEPSLDYVVLKIPRWPFDKFSRADNKLGTQMKSTGEVMAIGRGVEEAVLKAIRSLDIDKVGLESLKWSDGDLLKELVEPTDQRMFAIAEALRREFKISTIADLTKWHPFFIRKIRNIVDVEKQLKGKKIQKDLLRRAKRYGFSDECIANFLCIPESKVRELRCKWNILPTYKMVDTCAAEFEAKTPYFYSTYGDECEVKVSKRKKVLIVGSGPIRIGQGIEFDYCCVHGVLALREEGIEALIINNNPETVSTDFDISDRLYFEPITLEDVLNVIEKEKVDGIILQFGGQTSVNLAVPLQKELAKNHLKTKILGTSAESIDTAEDRKRFGELMDKLGILQPRSYTGFSFEEVKDLASQIGYPILVRPSYVLGGRAMEIVYNEEELKFYMKDAEKASKKHPILIDKYLTNAVEVDVDAVCDKKDVFIGAIQEHIEQAGVHSGDAACIIPSQTLSGEVIDKIKEITEKISRALEIEGLINLQLAVKDDKVYVLEANPRASRTVPYVSKAIGIPLAKIATKVMLGCSLKQLGFLGIARIRNNAVKMPVFPFAKLPGVDCILGPEMKSTGEVMGIDSSLGRAYYKAMIAAGNNLPSKGTIYITVKDDDKTKVLPIAKKFMHLGYSIAATKGTSSFLKRGGVNATTVYRISDKHFPDAIGLMRKGIIKLIINTPTNRSGDRRDGYMMRRLAVDLRIPFITTIQGALAAVNAVESIKKEKLEIRALGEYNSI